MLHTWTRRGIGDRGTRLLLARRAQLSDLPGNRASMENYEAAIRAGGDPARHFLVRILSGSTDCTLGRRQP